MMTLMPRWCAVLAYSIIRSGVLCADTTLTSHGTPNSSRICAAAFMVGRSESEPMMMPTWGWLLLGPAAAAGAAAAATLLLVACSAAVAAGSICASLARADSRVLATMLMWPTCGQRESSAQH